MKMFRFLALCGAACLLMVSPVREASAADTLITKAANDAFSAGVAKSWKITGSTVVFSLAEGTNTAAWAALIKERLAGATVTEGRDQLTVTGIPGPALLEQLSGLSLGGDADPLSELAGLGGGVGASAGPEGGGSIRASKPTPLAGGSRVIKEHDPKMRFEAEVLEVQRGEFPVVKLKLKMRRGDRSNPLSRKLYYGKVIEAAVVYAGSELLDATNRRNLVGWYLEAGDRVVVHPIAVGESQFEIDYLVRTR